MSVTILKVSQLNRYVKSIIESDAKLHEIFVRGEISDFKMSYNGHAYFSLKDDKAVVKCAMFAKNVEYLKFVPHNGDDCIVRGFAGLYEQTGIYTLYIQELSPYGEGDASKQLNDLKNKLEALGYFDESRKKNLPSFPLRIGVVTSLQGAAIGDIIKTINSKYPLGKIVISPAAVQGDFSISSICSAIERIISQGNCDVIIVGRGGGSAEDLNAFNSEEVVKSVFLSPVPIISAVGHEKDITLCDIVSDARAATPTAAAQMAVPNIKDLIQDTKSLEKDLILNFNNSINLKKKQLNQLYENKYLENFDYCIRNKTEYVEKLKELLKNNFSNAMNLKHKSIYHLSDILNAYSPINVLKRGFSYIEKDKKTLVSVKNINKGDNIVINLADGRAEAVISQVEGGYSNDI